MQIMDLIARIVHCPQTGIAATRWAKIAKDTMESNLNMSSVLIKLETTLNFLCTFYTSSLMHSLSS